MPLNIYKVTFNSNHPKVAMKTTVWIHEDVLNYFKGHIKAYAIKHGKTDYTEQQIFIEQYVLGFRKLIEKYEVIGLTDLHVKSLSDEYKELLLKNDLLEKFSYFVVPKHLDLYFQSPRIDIDKAMKLLNYVKGANGIVTPGHSDWIGYHERKNFSTLNSGILL